MLLLLPFIIGVTRADGALDTLGVVVDVAFVFPTLYGVIALLSPDSSLSADAVGWEESATVVAALWGSVGVLFCCTAGVTRGCFPRVASFFFMGSSMPVLVTDFELMVGLAWGV